MNDVCLKKKDSIAKTATCLQDGYQGQDRELIDTTKKLNFMPVTLKRSAINHMIMVVYNQEQEELEIYDPQARPLKELLEETILCPRNYLKEEQVRVRTLKDYIDAKISELRIKTLRTNHVREQYDIHSCGMFAATYMHKRLEGFSAEEIMEKGNLTITDVNKLRKDLVEEIKNAKKN